MSIRNPVYRETAAIAVGEVLCVGLMLGVYALAGQLDRAAVLGGVLGGVLAICNFFFRCWLWFCRWCLSVPF